MRKILQVLLLINFIYVCYIILKLNNFVSKKRINIFKSDQNNLTILKEYSNNREYLINGNLAQYSSYIIIDKDEQNNDYYRIEALVALNKVKLAKNYKIRANYLCVVKFIDKLNSIVDLQAVEGPRLSKHNRKLVFNLNSIYKNFLERIAIAIIWKEDFNINSNSDDLTKWTIYDKLPRSLIKFQIPTIIRSHSPRLPSVSFCVHFTYDIPSHILNWIDYHLEFGVKEIMFYDAMISNNLTRLLERTYGNDTRITIMSYDISYDSICSERKLFQQYEDIALTPEIRTYLIKSCKNFFTKEFNESISRRAKHEQITANDCYMVMRQKHEFIGYYDLDEIVYPRSIDKFSFNEIDLCNQNHAAGSICSSNPFNNNFYTYLHSLIKKDRLNRNISELVSINFPHAATFMPDDLEKGLINDLELIIVRILNSTDNYSLFPLKLVLQQPNDLKAHSFEIKNEDVYHIKYLYIMYKNLIQCTSSNYLNRISKISKNFVRYMYYLTEVRERMGKQIYYYKNAKTIWIHTPLEIKRKSWFLNLNDSIFQNQHFVAHYRQTPKPKRQDFTGSILKLNIDF